MSAMWGQMAVVAFIELPQADVVERILRGTRAERWSAASGACRHPERCRPLLTAGGMDGGASFGQRAE